MSIEMPGNKYGKGNGEPYGTSIGTFPTARNVPGCHRGWLNSSLKKPEISDIVPSGSMICEIEGGWDEANSSNHYMS